MAFWHFEPSGRLSRTNRAQTRPKMLLRGDYYKETNFILSKAKVKVRSQKDANIKLAAVLTQIVWVNLIDR